MKKLYKMTAVLGCMLALGGMSVLQNAPLAAAAAKPVADCVEAPLDAFAIDQEKLRAPELLTMRGTIEEIDGAMVTVRGEGRHKRIAAMLNAATYVVDGSSGKLRMARALKVGQSVEVYYSSVMTRSLPPQTQAYAIVIGDSDKDYLPQYFVVDKVKRAADDSFVYVLNSTNDVIATVDATACADYLRIKQGDKLLLWSRIMTMSLPGQTNAEKAVILP